MKNKIFIVTLCFLSLCVQAQWNKINVNTTKSLNSIAQIDANNLMVVGDTGTLIKLTNKGQSFSTITSSITKNLNDVCFVSSSIGYAVGNSGTIIKTINGGSTWNPQTSNTSSDLNGVKFLDANNGLAVGSNGTILRTQNGGSTWTVISPITIYILNKVTYISSTVAIACGGNGLLLKSTNGGKNWTIKSTGTTKVISNMYYYPEEQKLMAVGNKGLLLTCDSALTTFSKDSISSQWLFGIAKEGYTDSIFVVGKNANILYSPNWAKANTTETADLHSVAFINDTMGIIVGANGLVLRTITGGVWNEISDINSVSVQVYPNPSSDQFNIESTTLGSNFQVMIYSVNGSLVFQQNCVSASITTIHHNLSDGLYLLQIISDTSLYSQSILIQ